MKTMTINFKYIILFLVLTVIGFIVVSRVNAAPATPPTVTSPTVSGVTTIEATLGANVTSNGGATITARGTCWGTSASPTTNCLAEGGTAIAPFVHARTGMSCGTSYFYRGYATNSKGTGYSPDGTFITAPCVTSPTASSVTTTGATLGANVTLNGGATLTARGTCWGTSASPTTNCLAEGGTTTGVFAHARTGMSCGISYFYRGYATNTFGTGYSPDGTFTASSCSGSATAPSIDTPTVSSITSSGATLGANIISNGGSAVTSRGTCWATSPFVDGFQRLSNNPDILPNGSGEGVAFSPNGTYLSVAHRISPFLTIYKRSGDMFTRLADPSALPSGSASGTAFSPDNTYLAVIQSSIGQNLGTPYANMYKRSGDTFTRLSQPFSPNPPPGGSSYGPAFSPDGVYFSYGSTSYPHINIYKRNGDTFNKLSNPDVLPVDSVHSTAFSPDGVYLAVMVLNQVDNTSLLIIYKRNGDTFTKLPDPDVMPIRWGRGVAFSPDSNYLSVTMTSYPYIYVYKRNGNTFTKLPTPDYLPAIQGSSGWSTAFSPDGEYLSLGYSTYPYINIYKRNGDTFTKIPDPATLPTGWVYGTAFSPDSNYLAVTSTVSPFLLIYKKSFDTTNCTSEGGTGTGVFNQTRTGMPSGTLIYYRGYATNAVGTAYSNTQTFTTLLDPLVTNFVSSSCTIPEGGKSCPVTLSWNVASPEVPLGTAITSNKDNNGNPSFNFIVSPPVTMGTIDAGAKADVSISRGSRTFYLYNNAKSLFPTPPSGAGLVVTANCASGLGWDDINKKCTAASPSPSITAFYSNPKCIDESLGSTPVNVTYHWTTENADYCESSTGLFDGQRNLPSGSGSHSDQVPLPSPPNPINPTTFTPLTHFLQCNHSSEVTARSYSLQTCATYKKKPEIIEGKSGN